MGIEYQDYLDSLNENVFGGDQYYKRRKGRIRPISEDKFNILKNTISAQLYKRNYTSREEAQRDLEIKIQQMGPVTFFLFRVLIGWLIGRLLDIYFPEDESNEIA